ncbi:TPA: SUMF1/EgtB/PvdO family nonheme iron enzyme [Vibrio mimicus]
MRQGIPALLIALSPCLMAAPVLAEEVASSVLAIDDALFGKHTELQNATDASKLQKAAVDNQQSELNRLTQQAKALDTALKNAKTNLERDYQKMIDEPDLDIQPSQNAYQAAWAEVKQNQVARLDAEQKLQEMQTALAQYQAQQQTIEQSIALLQQDKMRARVDRLREELQRVGEQKVSFTNVCNADMTLAQCSKQTNDLALQKAVNQFQLWLVDESSESNVIKPQLNNVSLNIHVLKHAVLDSGFYDGMRFRSIVNAQLEARPAENAPCKLLNIDSQYCFAPGQGQLDQQQQEIAWISLSLRSNQHGDRVTVDGVNYGSTPVEVMLPVGKHLVQIEKEGFRSFQQEVNITSDQTLRVNLHEKTNPLRTGAKFADSLKGKVPTPEVITITPGQYFLGENASKQYNLDHAFALSATPVTVAQFEAFVNQSNYQTDAELKKLCISVDESEVAPVSDSYWRNPGFKQSKESPVVCISQNDAKAYARWLSKQTGFKYRLPTEEEWEIAARAGSKADYWWGKKFGAGKANTGWGGTTWSNKSTSPVKAFAPNALGFYDMVGNVWEWTGDSRGLAKGGAWSFSPEMAKAYSELFVSPTTAANYVGFRVLREL